MSESGTLRGNTGADETVTCAARVSALLKLIIRARAQVMNLKALNPFIVLVFPVVRLTIRAEPRRQMRSNEALAARRRRLQRVVRRLPPV